MVSERHIVGMNMFKIEEEIRVFGLLKPFKDCQGQLSTLKIEFFSLKR